MQPDQKHAWLNEGINKTFTALIPMVAESKPRSLSPKTIFTSSSLGVSTNRDAYVYGYNKLALEARVDSFISDYNAEVARWIGSARPKGTDLDNFVKYDKVKWSEHLKKEMAREKYGEFDHTLISFASYRPFSKKWIYYSSLMVDRPGSFEEYFPTPETQIKNRIICLTDSGSEKPFMAMVTNSATDLHFVGSGVATQCFPLYTYALDGKIRRENITDWALTQFRAEYGSDVTKPNIFHYVYALLHHPEYRERYKENLKRELPRVPLVEDVPPAPILGSQTERTRKEGAASTEGAASNAPTSCSGTPELGRGGIFRTFVSAGERLAALHLGYEQADEYPLTWTETEGVPFSWRVTKMRLSGDKTELKVNAGLTLSGIPPEVFQYRLGNRSALEWVLDQYQVTTDKRSGIGSDPNRSDDPEYIVRLVGRVITVSTETVKIVGALPTLGFGAEKKAASSEVS